jgi:magnesium transporter
VAWIALYKPTEEEFGSVAGEFGLHPLAAEDPMKAPVRTKLEHYEGTLFLVLKAARYLDESETVEFGEVDTFVGENFVVMVLRGEPAALAPMRERLQGDPELFGRDRGRYSTRSSTGWWTATPLWWRAWRTT